MPSNRWFFRLPSFSKVLGPDTLQQYPGEEEGNLVLKAERKSSPGLSPLLPLGLCFSLLVASPTPLQAEGWLGAEPSEPKKSQAEASRGGPLRPYLGDLKGLDLFGGIAMEPNPQTARRFYRDGRDKLKDGQFPLVISRFRSAYKRGHPRADLDYYIGSALIELKRPRKALFHLDRALIENQMDPDLWLQAGIAFRKIDNQKLALRALQESVSLDPDQVEPHVQLAGLYDEMDNSPRVLEHSQKAMRIDPSVKPRLKALIKESNVSRKISRIVTHVLRDSKAGRLSDDQIRTYSKQLKKAGVTQRPFAPPPPTLRRPVLRKPAPTGWR